MKNSNNSFRPCPICKDPHPFLYRQATNSLPTFSYQIQVTDKHFGHHGDIVKCRACNFNYIGRKSYVQNVINLYEDMRDEVYVTEEKERRRSFISILNTVKKLRGGAKSNLLDVGCCTGGLLVEAAKCGWIPTGVDPSTWACQMGKKLHHLSIFNGLIEEYKSAPKYFDTITMLDLLEHVEKPLAILQKANRMLKDTGIMCIVTPNFGSVTAKILGMRWWGIRLAHLSYFRSEDLYRLFKQSGFRIIKSKPYIRYFSLYYILVRLLPIIEKTKRIKLIMKHLTVPLVLFDTFEFYLAKDI